MQDGRVPAEAIPEQDAAAARPTLAAAARRAGCSIDTVRRRLNRGGLEARQVATRHAPARQVRLSGLQTVGSDPAQAARPVGVAELVRLVRHQQQAIPGLRGRVGYFQAQLEQARETFRALEAPKRADLSPELSADPQAATAAATRPRWRRWFGHA